MRALNKVRAQSPELPPGVFDERWFGFRGAGRRITTQHVIAEALKIERQGWLLDHKDEVWESMFSLLGEFPVEEHPCSFDELRADSYRRVMIELGPTDAGLLLIATRCKATLVTEDRHLLHWAHDLAVPALPINQIGRS
ncbi:MAG: hypothetical protein LAP87_01755 [Acidobacteriia bacterium]|nr:hypothetical protein [Terriglobia bacterium]